MYNRYLNSTYGDHPYSHTPSSPSREPSSREPPCPPPDMPNHAPSGKNSGGIFSGLSEALTGRLQNLHFDLDTLIVIIAVYFLIADSEDFDTDLLVLIGVLFVLGM